MIDTDNQKLEGLTATYSPDDNKIRISSECRIDTETFARLKAAGYKWAPKQGVMVAPMWTPAREALALELAGEIGDDDTSLISRAEQRAERFDEYSEKRASDAKQAKGSADAIAGNIPLGQPILVGHHSQRRAERDAQKIENSLHKAAKMWDTSVYWERRAAGAIEHAKYKEKPEVRARRIKKIEADKRRVQRSIDDAQTGLKLWTQEGLTLDKARVIAGHVSFGLRVFRDPEDGYHFSAWDVLRPKEERYKNCPDFTLEQVQDVARRVYPKTISHYKKWIAHYDNRLTYEKAMLGEQGRSDLIAPKKRPKQLPICNYRQPEGFTIENPRYYANKTEHYEQVELTKEQYKTLMADYKGTRAVEGSHRIRVGAVGFNKDGSIKRWGGYGAKNVAIFLTDSKVHKKPEPVEPKPPEPPKPRAEYKAPERSEAEKQAEAARQRAQAGVTVATGEQLFITPPELAARVIEEAGIEAGDFVLEPSAGTGALLDVLPAGVNITAVEQSVSLAQALNTRYSGAIVHKQDFLSYDCPPKYDRIVMNPPFSKQADIDHVTHAFKMLKEGGRLVAIMSAGASFRSDKKATAFRSLVERQGGVIEALPAGSFKGSGTGVNTVIVTIDK